MYSLNQKTLRYSLDITTITSIFRYAIFSSVCLKLCSVTLYMMVVGVHNNLPPDAHLYPFRKKKEKKKWAHKFAYGQWVPCFAIHIPTYRMKVKSFVVGAREKKRSFFSFLPYLSLYQQTLHYFLSGYDGICLLCVCLPREKRVQFR